MKIQRLFTQLITQLITQLFNITQLATQLSSITSYDPAHWASALSHLGPEHTLICPLTNWSYHSLIWALRTLWFVHWRTDHTPLSFGPWGNFDLSTDELIIHLSHLGPEDTLICPLTNWSYTSLIWALSTLWFVHWRTDHTTLSFGPWGHFDLSTDELIIHLSHLGPKHTLICPLTNWSYHSLIWALSTLWFVHWRTDHTPLSFGPWAHFDLSTDELIIHLSHLGPEHTLICPLTNWSHHSLINPSWYHRKSVKLTVLKSYNCFIETLLFYKYRNLHHILY